MSRLFSNLVTSQEKFLRAALGSSGGANPLAHSAKDLRWSKRKAIWEYMVQTLDPGINTSLIGEDNPYYLVCMQGAYSQRCHPDYLAPKSHQRPSRGHAFDGLRIHTDRLEQDVSRLTPATLTVAVVMDRMDWVDPAAGEAVRQTEKLHRARKLGGRVLLRSVALAPWYISRSEDRGFQAHRVGARIGGACIDRFVSRPPPYQFEHFVDSAKRVNMYASCWLLTKPENIALRKCSMDLGAHAITIITSM
ncbi:unnamed protein product [Diplocarpon coronariae]|uniref:Uncharacterized protein n=1 Tax=Diplocarpon coronariae TaxID=2795749 RepID=A0A218Z3G8_9HELO|nr:hypothetical protein B2J93_1264 [Marssonina coronariae]